MPHINRINEVVKKGRLVIEINRNYYKLCLFDTNALSEFLKSPMKWIHFFKEEFSLSSTIISYSAFSLIELAESSFLFDKYLEFFSTFPSVILDGFQSIFLKELKIYYKNNEDVNPIVISPFCSGLESKLTPKERVKFILDKSGLFDRKKYWDSGRKDVLEGITSLTRNYPPINKKYSQKEVELFVKVASMQQIELRDAEFFHQVTDNKKKINLLKFPSIISTSYVVFYKFYPDKRKPIISDVYDIIISSLLPYVDYVITESNLCEILRKIQTKHSFLKELKYYPIKYVR